jgi:hypothetical protein
VQWGLRVSLPADKKLPFIHQPDAVVIKQNVRHTFSLAMFFTCLLVFLVVASIVVFKGWREQTLAGVRSVMTFITIIVMITVIPVTSDPKRGLPFPAWYTRDELYQDVCVFYVLLGLSTLLTLIHFMMTLREWWVATRSSAIPRIPYETMKQMRRTFKLRMIVSSVFLAMYVTLFIMVRLNAWYYKEAT